MRRMMLVVGIGAGLFAVALPVTDSMAVELVIKKNFNLPPATGNSQRGSVNSRIETYAVPEPSEPFLSPPGHRLVLKKNFNLPKLVLPPPGPEYPNEKVISVDLADPDPYDGQPPSPTDVAEGSAPHDDYYRLKIIPPLPADGGKDHDDSTDRDDRRSRLP